MTPQTPQTAAGRAFVDTWQSDWPQMLDIVIAIEAEARASEHERAVDACARMVIAAKAEARAGTLDVDVLARALGRVNDMASYSLHDDAVAIAAEYARLAAEETPALDTKNTASETRIGPKKWEEAP